ncbi:MAG: hypothetical protein IJ396_07750 [Oscillibacter sp.]|nr:hypothetical protein [Oscillibacter sp.]MBQ7778790.1 hypothetical protein [Oscillibacter sp.]
MAEFSVDGLDGLIASLQEVAEMPEEVQDEILHAQADALIPEIQKRGYAYGVVDPESGSGGKMLRSIKKGKVRMRKGYRYIVVAPRGTRKRGKTKTTNAAIGFFNNYGARGIPARPFWTDAVETSARTVEKAGMEPFDRYLQSKDL